MEPMVLSDCGGGQAITATPERWRQLLAAENRSANLITLVEVSSHGVFTVVNASESYLRSNQKNVHQGIKRCRPMRSNIDTILSEMDKRFAAAKEPDSRAVQEFVKA